jgi:glycosyltransferase involved in cell wall biosynthesis
VILLDVSRLLSRAGRETPTGIDRVELAYAGHLIGAAAPRCFVAMGAGGRFGALPQAEAEAYIGALAAAWRGDNGGGARHAGRAKALARRLRVRLVLQGESGLYANLRGETEPPAYLLVSHHHLEKRRLFVRLRQRGRVRFVCLIHDLIPIEFPEYALPGQDRRHRRRIETAAELADGVIVNSRLTGAAFRPYLDRAGRSPLLIAAPFGVDPPAPDGEPPAPAEPPYFVCVGTIEARKNHLLLLNLWRRLAAELGERTPRLVLVGQRGWESENAIDMLERCPGLQGIVREHNRLPDRETARLVRGARALLLPSFAEGFGFPLVEALVLGVPVLCSDIPALRENGAEVPEFFDPLDGVGWHAAIRDYARPDSPRRRAQLGRLARWRPVRWADHFAAVEALIAQVCAAGPGAASGRGVPSSPIAT